MKKRIIMLAVISVLGLTACNKITDAIDKASSAATSGKGESDKIIAYNNALVSYFESANKSVDKLIDDDYPKLETVIGNKSKGNELIMFHAFIATEAKTKQGYGTDEIDILKPDNYLSEKNAELTKTINEANTHYQNIKKAYEEMKKYIDNEDYKDDNWAKGQKLLDIFKVEVPAYDAARDKVWKIFTPIADKAEEEILKDHPLKENILIAKKALTLTEDINTLLSAEKPDMAQVDKKYAELEKNMTDSKNINSSELDKQYKKTQYENFYKNVDSYLGELRKIKRDGTIEDNELQSLGYRYDSVLSSYNSFVN